MGKPKRKTVQPDDIIEMNELYLTIGTYAGVGRATGWSGSTVKRYIIPNYVAKDKQEKIEPMEFDVPAGETLIYPAVWSDFLQLTNEEQIGISELQKTISI